MLHPDRSQGRELFWKHVPRLFRAHQENLQIFDASLLFEFPYDVLSNEFFRLKIDMQMKSLSPVEL